MWIKVAFVTYKSANLQFVPKIPLNIPVIKNYIIFNLSHHLLLMILFSRRVICFISELWHVYTQFFPEFSRLIFFFLYEHSHNLMAKYYLFSFSLKNSDFWQLQVSFFIKTFYRKLPRCFKNDHLSSGEILNMQM